MNESSKRGGPNPLETIAAYASDYKHVTVNLYGVNGNTIVIVGKVRQALKRDGAPTAVLDVFSKEALSGDYDHAIATCMDWVNIIFEEEEEC